MITFSIESNHAEIKVCDTGNDVVYIEIVNKEDPDAARRYISLTRDQAARLADGVMYITTGYQP
jgi:diaminopimelate epimerase